MSVKTSAASEAVAAALARERRDIEIINRNSERLNREAQDTLEYQRCLETPLS